MAYEKKTQSILAGSVNLLPPADIIPEEDALVIRNFRCNTAGSLRSRAGMVSLGSPANPDSICRVDGGISSQRRYASAAGTLYCNGSAVGSGFGATYPLGMVSFQGFLWATSPSKQAKHDGSSLTPWAIAAPPAALTATAGTPTGPGLTGIYSYYVTLVDANGYESASSAGATVTLAAQAAVLTAIPTGPSGIVARRIYRAGGTQADALRITEILDNSTTTYTDELSDLDAEELGILFDSQDNDPPPAATGVVGPYYDRLLCFASTANPNRIWYSKQLQPYAFPGSADTAGNWFDVGEKGEFILAMTIRPRQVTIYKEKTIWRLVGDPGSDDSSLELITNSQGIVGRKAVASEGGYDYFVSADGAMSFNGESVQKISRKMEPFFLGEYPDTYMSGLGTPFFTPRRSQVVMAAHRGQVWISLPTDDVANNATVKYEIESKRWVQDSRGFSALYNEGQNGDFLGGTSTGISAVEDNVSDNGSAIALDYEGHFNDQGSPENEKMYADLVVEINTNGAALSATALTNNGQEVTALGAVSTLQRDLVTLPINLRARNFALKIAGTVNTSGSVNGDVHIYKATLHYYVLARQSKTFDSDVTDLGTRDVKLCDFLELDVEVAGSGTVTYSIFTDRPTPAGAGLASRATGTFTASATGRRMLRFPLTQCEGQLFRLLVTADADSAFLLYSAALRVRPIGAYVDGANGESFKTKEIGVGI